MVDFKETILSLIHRQEMNNHRTMPSLLIIGASLLGLTILWSLLTSIYDVHFGPLGKFPGPKIRAFSMFPTVYNVIIGNDHYGTAQLHARYGPVVRIGPRLLSYAKGAEAWKDIYGFRKNKDTPMPYKDLEWATMYSKRPNLTDDVLVAPDGEHGRHRKIIAHAFSDRALREQTPLLSYWAAKLVGKLREKAKGGKKVDMEKYLSFATFDIMADLTFAESLHMLETDTVNPWVASLHQFEKIFTFFRGIRMLSPWADQFVENTIMKLPQSRTKEWEIFDFVKERVDKRLAHDPGRPDIWSKVLEKGTPESGTGYSLDEHHSNAFIMLSAGTETPATALSFTIYHLLTHPAALKRVVEEVGSTFDGTPGVEAGQLTLESLARLEYLNATIQEALRLSPPVTGGTLERTVPVAGAEICGEWVPGGTRMSVHQYAMYRSPDHFTKPNEYHPERWLGDPEFEGDHLDAVEPFSVGPRNCVGKNLAWHEMRLILAMLVLNFEMELCEESFGWEKQEVYVVWHKGPLMVRLTPRVVS